MQTTVVSLTVNGKERPVLVEPGHPLLSVIRDQLGLTAAGRGCADGSCGACTVLVNGSPTLSCLVPTEVVDGESIRTLGGEATDGQLTPVQQAFVDNYATQCGFCTSGMIMTATALIEELAGETDRPPTREDVARALCGNVCRCTGYEPIITAVLEAAGATAQAENTDQERVSA